VLHCWASTTYFCQVVETALVGALLVMAYVRPTIGSGYFEIIESGLSALANKPRCTFFLLGFGVIAARLVLLPLLPLPRASVHDEFSYLLAAQTFASGRITNEPHAMWPHFESIHILQQPTYMSMYGFGQGLFLAIGLRLTGVAWAGVVLSVALLCAVLFWMLKAWAPAPWALAGSFLVAARWGLVSYWMNSYWGGAVPALGGALVLGSLPRLLRNGRARDSFLLGLGLALLCNSRPYEGSVVSGISIAVFLWRAISRGQLHRLRTRTVAIPLCSVIVLTAAGMLTYNWRITGHPTRLPYVEDRQQYAIAPLFVLGRPNPPPQYRTASLRRVYEEELALYWKARSLLGFPEVFRKLKNIWIFFLGPLLSIPFFSFCSSVRAGRANKDRKFEVRLTALVLIAALAAMLQVVWFYPHYAAPAFAAFVAALTMGMRELRAWTWKGKPSGLFLCRTIPVACLLMSAIPIGAQRLGWELSYWPLQWAIGTPDGIHPPGLAADLLANGRKALVFVQYSPDHDIGDEWVYNSADIDSSPVVWARHISPESDAALVRYFSQRTAWELQPDQQPLKPTRYPAAPEKRGAKGSN